MSITKQGKELRAIGFDAASSFVLKLNDQTDLQAEAVLRILPGKRIVVSGIRQNKRVVAKLFLDKRNAKRHMLAEMTGNKLLKERNIPTPTLIGEAKSEDGSVLVLLFEQLDADINLMSAWQQSSVREELMPLLKKIMIEIATQHVFGLEQHDLHLNNFIIANNIIYTLDGAQIELHEEILAKNPSMKNLAMLLSQLGANTRHYQEELFKHYRKARGWLRNRKDMKALFALIDWWNAERWNHFKRKIYRNSTQFCSQSKFKNEYVFDRNYNSPEFLNFIKQPEAVFNRPEATILKNGRSSTVVRITLDGRELVIKRYNMKNGWHWLRRCLRATRAKKCWRIAQKLLLFGITTAKPVAYIETRFLGLRGKSYFVTDFVAGENIKTYLQNQDNNEFEKNSIIKQMVALIAGLKNIAVTHGDLKATNLLVNNDQEIVMIDLDGAKEHQSSAALQREIKKEWQRLLQNFDSEPTIKEKFMKWK